MPSLIHRFLGATIPLVAQTTGRVRKITSAWNHQSLHRLFGTSTSTVTLGYWYMDWWLRVNTLHPSCEHPLNDQTSLACLAAGMFIYPFLGWSTLTHPHIQPLPEISANNHQPWRISWERQLPASWTAAERSCKACELQTVGLTADPEPGRWISQQF